MTEGLVQRVIHKPFKALQMQRAVDFLLMDKAELGEDGMQTSILFVDDEEEITDFLKEFFDERHYTTFVANEAEKGFEIYNESKPDIVVTDIKMPGRDGIWLINEIRAKNQDANFIVMTGQDTKDTLANLEQETKITDYFSKPFTLQEIDEMLEVVIGIQLKIKKKKSENRR